MNTLKFEGGSDDPQKTLRDFLSRHMPEIFTEEKVDIKKLKATLGEDVASDDERYGLSWSGKMDCFRTIQETTTDTLVPIREESVDFDDTENLFIEGDNLQVLKTLQKSYYGKVKMIYIDPPYNTGNDFIYNDKFSQNKREYLEEIGAIDKDGNVLNASLYKQNTKDSGHFHSNWLNMMYPRLFLARNLLRDDGVIFVSIDDNEVHNLRAVMNEVFGEENFVTQIIWEKKYTRSNDAQFVSTNHDYILAFVKNVDSASFNSLPRTNDQIKAYKNPDNHQKGPWKATPLHAKSGNVTEFKFTFSNGVTWSPPKGTYPRFSKETLRELDKNNEIWFGKNGDAVPSRKTFLSEVKNGVVPVTIWSCSEVGHNHESNTELKELSLGGLFDNPKPTRLLKRMLQIGAGKDGLIIDFFAGSGTTAHAVMDLNAEDGGNRKWICVQLPEACTEGTEAEKAGFSTIADIAKERIRRAAKKIQEEHADAKADFGFKVFKLQESNFKIWDSTVDNEEQLEQQMLEMFNNVRKGVTEEAMLYELLLKSGKELNVPMEKIDVGDAHYFKVNDGSLLIFLGDKVDEKIWKSMLEQSPGKVVLMDKAFGEDDALKTNLLLQAESAGVDEVRVI